MNCDCGPPGIPFDGSINTEIKSNFSENFIIEYECENGPLIYDRSRTCKEGKWTGRVPKCGIYSIIIYSIIQNILYRILEPRKTSQFGDQIIFFENFFFEVSDSTK
jgi:hypothetical protein